MKNKTENVSYSELARRVGDCILCNEIVREDENLFDNLENGEFEACECGVSGCDIWGEAEHEKTQKEIYQYYIITKGGADYLKRNTDEIVFYSDFLDVYVWGITHFGTGWDCVFTNIKE
jgi:hypothetical protein